MLNTIGFERLSSLKPGQNGFIIDFTRADITNFLFEAGCLPGDHISIQAIETGLIFAHIEKRAVYIPLKIADHIITHPINLIVCLN